MKKIITFLLIVFSLIGCSTTYVNRNPIGEYFPTVNITFADNGKTHIAYFPKNHIIGLSKLDRIAQYYAKRPLVQERLTMQIANDVKDTLQTDDVTVLIDADHLCVTSRGVNDVISSTITSSYNGKFLNDETRKEFLSHVNIA